MAAQRFLIATLLALAMPDVTSAQSVAMPHWVQASASCGKATAVRTGPGVSALDAYYRGEHVKALLNTTDLAKNVRPLLTHNRLVLSGKKPPASRFAGRAVVALTAVGAGYDLYNGTLTMRDAGIQAAQLGASTAASSAVFAGMLYFAGTVGTASTGTAIASLSGAAYTSAATAWWGGGSVAAGGLGVSGGTIIITGGAAVVAIGVGYGVYKLWNIYDPAEREAMDITVTWLLVTLQPPELILRFSAG